MDQITSVPSVPVKDGMVCSFMNCDTGRRITVKGETSFKIKMNEDETCNLMLGDKYVILNGGAHTSNAPEPITIYPLKNNRYLLAKTYCEMFCDDDKGPTNDASLSVSDVMDRIDCCWYITESGKPQPLRIMTIGDSITYGANTDLAPLFWYGCRPRLAELIASDPENRFVFVGSMKEHTSRFDETALYRHEGHGGWMGVDNYQINPESRGLIDYIDEFFTKYVPDVIMTQVGTNDCAFAAGSSMYEEIDFTDETMGALKARWNAYMDKMWEYAPNAAMIVATVPPTTRTKRFNDWIEEFNKEIPLAVTKYIKEGKRAAVAQTNKYISESTPEKGLCSDMVHLSEAGYIGMGNALYEAFKKLYPNGSCR